MSEPILEVINLKKYFNTPGGVLHAVDDISFTPAAENPRWVVPFSVCMSRPPAR